MHLEEIGRLQLDDGTAVSAASGLVRHDGALWVVADDLFLLARFPEDLSAPGERILLSDQVLPDDPAERKKHKPDLESLALMPDGSLLVLGSGSTGDRERGFRYGPDGTIETVVLSGLYAALRGEIDDLNIEGCAHAGEHLWLAQRGNGPKGADALVQCTLDLELVDIHTVPLPEGLNLTDLSPLPDGRLAFAAAHEASGSTYHDGEVTAAAIGILDGTRIDELHLLPHPIKIEGITPDTNGGFLLVADPDDPAQVAPLLRWVT